MKIYTALAGSLVFATTLNGGYVGLAAEQYIGAGWVENGYVGLTTYRVYADFDSEEDVLLAVNGSSLGAMSMASHDGAFYNDAVFGGLTAPLDLTSAGIWSNQWDTYVTIDTDDSAGDATALSPGFDAEVGGLAGDFTTSNAAWYVTPDDAPQGLSDGYRVLFAQLTVAAGDHWGIYAVVNLAFGDGTTVVGEILPAPGAAIVFGLAGISGLGRRRRW